MSYIIDAGQDCNMCTEHKILTWTVMLLLLSGVACSRWKVEYEQQHICALKGSSVLIPCSFYYPRNVMVLAVRWGHERENIYTGPFIYDSESSNASSRYQYVGDKNHNCSLKIQQVDHYDAGKHAFRFTTNSTDGRVEGWTGTVGSRLKVVELKIMVTTANGNDTLKEGDSVKLTCVNGCESDGLSASYTWFKGGQPIHEGAFLHFGSISSADSGNYSCSPQTQTRLISDVVNVMAEYGPKNTLVSVRPSSEVDVGSSVTLTCSTNANPTVEHYTWFKRGSDDVVVRNGPELNFTEISPNDGGQYLCRVVNKHGHQNSSIVTIKVKVYWPTFTRDVLIITTVAVLTVTAIIAIRRLCKKTSVSDPVPETDGVDDEQNAVYINWLAFGKNQSEGEKRCEGPTTEVIYATVDFNTRRTSNMWQRMDSDKDNDGVIYSTVCKGRVLNASYTEQHDTKQDKTLPTAKQRYDASKTRVNWT